MQNNLISVSGKISSGKDAIGQLIMFHKAMMLSPKMNKNLHIDNFFSDVKSYNLESNSGYEVKKFAYKLKQFVSMLTGIPVAELEKAEVKNSKLGEEWAYLVWFNGQKMLRVNPNRWSDYEPHRLKNYTVREMLQYLGTDLFRNQLHEDVWVNALFSDFKQNDSFGHDSKWIITDTRFHNEANAIKKRGGLSIRVINPEYKPYENEHISETALDDYDGFDAVIINDKKEGVKKLSDKVHELLLSKNLL